MIRLNQKGLYILIETKRLNKILYLDGEAYVWIDVPGIGQLLEVSRRQHKVGNVLSMGRYNLYDVEDETNLFDLPHLELETYSDQWQGYLLLNGLPTDRHRKTRLVPTPEVISTRFSRDTAADALRTGGVIYERAHRL